jgi:hypothetical protein
MAHFELMNLKAKAESLGYPNTKLKVVVEFSPANSALFKQLNQTSTSLYDLQRVVERGVLIGKRGHLQLIEWAYVKDIR